MVRGGPANRTVRKAKIFALTKGFRGRRKNCYSLAVRAAHRALQFAYIGRRLKKRDMRKLWIQRINFASQSHQISYSRFMNSLVKCDVQLNRKVLSELAIHEPKTFAALAGVAKQRWQAGAICSLHQDPFSAPKHYGQAPANAAMYNGRTPYQGRPGKRGAEGGGAGTNERAKMSERSPGNRSEVPDSKEGISNGKIGDTLYQTRTVLDKRTGKAVMETAV